MSYRWKADENDFAMPIRVGKAGALADDSADDRVEDDDDAAEEGRVRGRDGSLLRQRFPALVPFPRVCEHAVQNRAAHAIGSRFRDTAARAEYCRRSDTAPQHLRGRTRNHLLARHPARPCHIAAPARSGHAFGVRRWWSDTRIIQRCARGRLVQAGRCSFPIRRLHPLTNVAVRAGRCFGARRVGSTSPARRCPDPSS